MDPKELQLLSKLASQQVDKGGPTDVKRLQQIGVTAASLLGINPLPTDGLAKLGAFVDLARGVPETEIILPVEQRPIHLNFLVGQLVRMVRFIYDNQISKKATPEEIESTHTLINLSKQMAVEYAKYYIDDIYDPNRYEALSASYWQALQSLFSVKEPEQMHVRLFALERHLVGLNAEENIPEMVFTGTWPKPGFDSRDAVRLHEADPDLFGCDFGLASCMGHHFFCKPNETFNIFRPYFVEIGNKYGASSPSDILILGNVARGIMDAALIHHHFTRNGFQSDWDLYRFSPEKAGDRNAVITESTADKIKKARTVILVDSFSAGGRSIPGSLESIRSYCKVQNSHIYVFISRGGQSWVERDPGFRWLAASDSVPFPKPVTDPTKVRTISGPILFELDSQHPDETIKEMFSSTRRSGYW